LPAMPSAPESLVFERCHGRLPEESPKYRLPSYLRRDDVAIRILLVEQCRRLAKALGKNVIIVQIH